MEVATFEPAILVKSAVMSVGSPGDWNGVYPAVYSNVRTPRAQQSTDLLRVVRGHNEGRRGAWNRGVDETKFRVVRVVVCQVLG